MHTRQGHAGSNPLKHVSKFYPLSTEQVRRKFVDAEFRYELTLSRPETRVKGKLIKVMMLSNSK